MLLFDTGTWLYCSMSDSARWVSTGALCRYLHECNLVLDQRNHLQCNLTPSRSRGYAYVVNFDAVRAELTELMMHRPMRR